MEIDITRFVNRYDGEMHAFSDSVANSGLENIGQVTWRNAMAAMADVSACLVLPAQCDELVDHFAGYGAWERSELEAMSCHELNALLVQFIAGDYQTWEALDFADCEERPCNLYASDDAKTWYYTVGG